MKRTLTLFALAALLAPSTSSALQVRSDRPRILFSNGSGRGTSVATYKQRCAADPAYKSRCASFLSATGGQFPAMNRAAAYVVTGDPARCAEAFAAAQSQADEAPGTPDEHSFISNNQRTMLQLAAVRDWCDPALSAAEKGWLEGRMVLYADWYVAHSAFDVFHDDMNNVWAAVAEAGLALKGTAYDAKADGYLAAADRQFKQVILPAMAYVGDWWHEGFTYVQPAIATLAFYATAWSIATDEDVFAYARTQANDVFAKYIDFHAWAMRPDYRYVYFGDVQDTKQSVELFSRYLVDMLTLGTGSPLGQALSAEIKANSRAGYDYAGADAWMLPLFYDATREAAAQPRSTLPTAKWLSKGAQDVAILRSGWGRSDTFVYVSCGDYLGPHQHYESGSFQMFRYAPLTGPTGYYDAFDTDHWQNYYSQHSVHANTLAVYMPGEFFPTLQSLANRAANVNDGGQRVLRRDHRGSAYNNPDLPTYLAHKTGYPFTETGNLTTFADLPRHDYVACDVTAAYSSPGFLTNGNAAKVREVTRQFVFLPPETLVVFDRVESLDASFPKRFLLHGAKAPAVNGRTFTVTNGGGRLFAQSLLPAAARVDVVSGFQVEGKAHPPSSSGAESGGTRVEVVPADARARDYFLHVLTAAEATRVAGPATTVVEDAASATLTVDDGATVATVRFDKTGALGGRVTLRSRATGALLSETRLDGTPIADPGPGDGPDAGAALPVDAGWATPIDAGDGAADAGSGADAGLPPDAGAPPAPEADAGSSADAGEVTPPPTEPDAGGAPAPEPSTEPEGADAGVPTEPQGEVGADAGAAPPPPAADPETPSSAPEPVVGGEGGGSAPILLAEPAACGCGAAAGGAASGNAALLSLLLLGFVARPRGRLR